MFKNFKIRNFLYYSFFLFIFFITSLYLSEYFLEKLDPISNPHISNKEIDIKKRFINFREHPLNLEKYFVASKLQIKSSPSLKGRKFIYKTDENGFLLPGNRHKDSELRIFFLGGSTTENLMVQDTNRFTFVFQNNLEKFNKKKINVYNSGRSKNNSLHSYNILFNKILSLKPTHIFLMHNVNDYNSIKEYRLKSLFNNFADTERNQITDAVTTKYFTYLKFRSIFFDTFPNLALRIQSIKLKFFPSLIKKKHSYNLLTKEDYNYFYSEKLNILELYYQLSLIFDFELILITQPENYEKNTNNMYLEQLNLVKEIHKKSNEIYRKFAKANELIIVDLAKFMNDKNEYFYDDIHFNDTGSQFIGIKIFENTKNDIN